MIAIVACSTEGRDQDHDHVCCGDGIQYSTSRSSKVVDALKLLEDLCTRMDALVFGRVTPFIGIELVLRRRRSVTACKYEVH